MKILRKSELPKNIPKEVSTWVDTGFLGLEKESCCWRFRFIWRRFSSTLLDDTNPLLDPEDNEMDEGFFIQMELKGLTSFGDKVDEFLEKNLSGYQSPE
jgi:LPS-assembly protein